MQIEINGVWYEPRQQGQQTSKGLTILGALAIIYAPISPRIQKPLPTNDVVKEFELIQLKKSKLTRSERDRVERVFHKQYKQIK